MLAEAKLLRQHKGRLEARMQILEDHNRQLEAQLQRLRQLLDEVYINITDSVVICNFIVIWWTAKESMCFFFILCLTLHALCATPGKEYSYVINWVNTSFQS